MELSDPGPEGCRLVLARHAQSVSNAEGFFAGQTDVGLTENGRAQAAALGERLRGIAFGAAYASTLTRAEETARIAVEPYDLDVETLPELRERCFGVLEGKDKSEETEYRDPGTTDRSEWRPPEGENRDDVADRVLPVIERLAIEHRGETILVVAHGEVNRTVVASLASGDAAWGHRIEQENTALNVLSYTGSWTVDRVNDAAHLEAPMRTDPFAIGQGWLDNRLANRRDQPE